MQKLYKKVEGGYQLVALYDGQLPRHSPQSFWISVIPPVWTKYTEADNEPMDLEANAFQVHGVELVYSDSYRRYIYVVTSDISKIKSDKLDIVISQRIEYE